MSQPEPHPTPLASQVLWGRVATAAVVVVMAFGLGRCTAGGVPQDDVTALEAQVDDLQSSNDQLRSQVDSLNERLRERDTAPTETPTDTPTGQASTPPAPVEGAPGGTYTVAPGDTLHAIAIEVYGDRAMAQQIAATNGLDTSDTLQVGQVLQLPADG